MKPIAFYMVLFQTIRICYSSDWHFDHLEQCHRQYHSCSSGSKMCRCDSMCLYYDDCCFDAEVRKEASKALNTEYRTFLNKTSCELVTKGRKSKEIRAFMVSACPESSGAQADISNKCKQSYINDVLDIVPVTDIRTNVTFKNRHCAKCHGIQDWVPWLLKVSCRTIFYRFSNFPNSLSLIDEVMLKIKSVYCSYSFEPPQYTISRYCFQHYNYNLVSVLGNETTCDNRIFKPISYYHGFKMDYYRTIQCYIDSGNPNYPNVSQNVQCYVGKTDADENANVFTLSSLIDLSSLLHTHANVAQCGEKEIHLSNKIGCQLLYCPHNMEPFGGRCGDVGYTTQGKLLDVLFEVNVKILYHREIYAMFNGVVKHVLNQLSKGCTPYFQLLDFSGIKARTGTDIFSGKACSVVTLRYPLTTKSQNNCSIDYERALVANFVANYNETLSNGVSFHHVCDVTNLSCNCNFSFNNPTYIMTQYESGDRLPCPAVKVRFQENDTVINDFTKSVLNTTVGGDIYFDLNGTIIDSTDVIFSNGDYFVCVDTLISKYQMPTRQDSIHYRTIINASCTCVSMLCLLSFLIQYCVVPFMRNGKLDLILVLIIFLLIAQMCFLTMSVFTITNEFCEWLGLIHHFAWLGTFVFMFLCSFRLHREIRNLKTYSKLEKTLITVKYTCVGLAVIVIIILSTKIMNIYLAPTEKWYGGRVCFISQAFALLLSFIIPIFFILCGNIVVFVSIIYYISTTSMSTTSNTIKPKLILFMKISTLMGFIWLIGIVAVLAESEVLLVIFENIASLQGVFITLSFACNQTYCKDMQRENRSLSERTSRLR